MSLFVSFFVLVPKGVQGETRRCPRAPKSAQGEPRGVQNGAPEAPRVPKKSPGGSVQGTVAGRPKASGYIYIYIYISE